ncbi:MAG: hypothetical protein ACXWKY_14720 [Caulobacteraceae bacterium]
MVFHPRVRDIYDKLFRELDAVEAEVHIDKLDHAVQTARNLCEAVEKDPNSSRAQRELIANFKRGEDHEICRCIANQQKHFRRRDSDIATGGSVRQGFGVGRYGLGGYGGGEQSVMIDLADGGQISAHEFVRRVGAKLKPLF